MIIGEGRTISVIDLKTKKTTTPKALDYESTVAISPNGRFLTIAHNDASFSFWSFPDLKFYLFSPAEGGHRHAINSIQYSRDGAYVVTSTGTHSIIWNFPSIKSKREPIHRTVEIPLSTKFAFSSDNRIAVGANSNSLFTFEFPNGEIKCIFDPKLTKASK